MSHLGNIYYAADEGEEVTSRPPLREVRSQSAPSGNPKIKTSQKQKDELLRQLVNFKKEADARCAEMLVLKNMR
jgi:hypothetical protein